VNRCNEIYPIETNDWRPLQDLLITHFREVDYSENFRTINQDCKRLISSLKSFVLFFCFEMVRFTIIIHNPIVYLINSKRKSWHDMKHSWTVLQNDLIVNH